MQKDKLYLVYSIIRDVAEEIKDDVDDEIIDLLHAAEDQLLGIADYRQPAMDNEMEDIGYATNNRN